MANMPISTASHIPRLPNRPSARRNPAGSASPAAKPSEGVRKKHPNKRSVKSEKRRETEAAARRLNAMR